MIRKVVDKSSDKIQIKKKEAQLSILSISKFKLDSRSEIGCNVLT